MWPQSALMHFLDPYEQDMFAQALQERNWQILIVEDLLDLIAAMEDGPTLILTDDPGLARSVPFKREESRPPVIVVVDDRDSAVARAYVAGADWVIVRPVNPDEPIGVNMR